NLTLCILVKIEFLGHAGICVSTEQTKKKKIIQ
ncbi:uncharacterized protein METZ01_LOCUS234126, partial [marine metagenome]